MSNLSCSIATCALIHSKGWGVEFNPYNRCASNKMIGGKKCTLVFHIDDNKLHHEDNNVVTNIMEKTSKYFEDLPITRRDAHDYLGINIKLRRDGMIAIH